MELKLSLTNAVMIDQTVGFEDPLQDDRLSFVSAKVLQTVLKDH
jgi:hypothetical protein